MNVSIEEKKAEALKRMKELGIFPETIKQFDQDGKLSRSEPPLGAFFWVEGEDLERVREFEAEQNALVYVVIRSYHGIGMMDSYLFASDHKDEWPLDHEGIKTGEVLAYVHNFDDPDCSEMGYICIEPTVAAGLKRTW